MKSIILVTLILVYTGTVTNAQNTNSITMGRSPVANSLPVNTPNMNYSHYVFEKIEFNKNPSADSLFNKEYYLKKSHNNKIASLCLLGGGAIITGIGILTFPKHYDIIFENDNSTENQANVSTTVIVVGIAAMLSSIPFTILSSVNKRKANLMVTSQKTGFGVPANVSRDITGITMTIPFGK